MQFSFLDKIRKDEQYRIKTFLRFSLVFNIAYSTFLFVIARVYFSRWFFVMSIYHLMLSTVRAMVFVQINPKKSERSKITTMRACGCFLLLINLIVSVMMFILVYESNPVKHHEITVITIAAYTFSALSVAIISSVKHFRKNNHVYFSAKIISLTSASVSMATLTNTMLATFGANNTSLRKVILPLLCGAIALFIILTAVFMIRKANADLRILKK